jgi:hypothetical protein
MALMRKWHLSVKPLNKVFKFISPQNKLIKALKLALILKCRFPLMRKFMTTTIYSTQQIVI